jgi:hypothetical protein
MRFADLNNRLGKKLESSKPLMGSEGNCLGSIFRMSEKATVSERIRLEPWEEIVGHFIELQERDGSIIIHLSSGTLVYDITTVDADSIRTDLNDCEGAVVGILRTEDLECPIKISVFDERNSCRSGPDSKRDP